MSSRRNRIISDQRYLEAKVVEFGTNGAHVTVPKMWLDFKVKVVPQSSKYYDVLE